MASIIVTTSEELSGMIDLAISKRINPLQELINNKLNPQKENVTVKEAAKRLNVTELTIRNYIKKGFIDASKIGRRIVINLESLESNLNEVKSLKYRR
ncbi:helix-turn-helix domain-containing protein [Tenacibaculum piscium]|uniref:helix-turn-helix domain-containing protein n=1 Tax=Tenacibaculum piscium TaxID=1458515 RepID=UPI001F41CBD3|nr:helix-turn-helix domain-containing protein [Tenacibaculum piscium]